MAKPRIVALVTLLIGLGCAARGMEYTRRVIPQTFTVDLAKSLDEQLLDVHAMEYGNSHLKFCTPKHPHILTDLHVNGRPAFICEENGCENLEEFVFVTTEHGVPLLSVTFGSTMLFFGEENGEFELINREDFEELLYNRFLGDSSDCLYGADESGAAKCFLPTGCNKWDGRCLVPCHDEL